MLLAERGHPQAQFLPGTRMLGVLQQWQRRRGGPHGIRAVLVGKHRTGVPQQLLPVPGLHSHGHLRHRPVRPARLTA